MLNIRELRGIFNCPLFNCTHFRIALFLLLVIIPIKTFSQDSLVNVADQYYENGEFHKSGRAYDAYFESAEGSATNFYNAACSWSLANQKEKALSYLDSAFVNGFSNINHVQSDSDLSNIRNTKKFQDLVDKEIAFYSKTNIDFKDVIEALLERKVVVFKNKVFSNSYGNWLAGPYSIKKVLKSFEQGTIKVSKDSLLDFSDRTLIIVNGKREIHLESLKLKKLELESTYPLSEGKENNDNIHLDNMVADEFNWGIEGYNLVRFFRIKSLSTNKYGSLNIKKFSIINSDLTWSQIYFEEGMHTQYYSFGSFDKPLGTISFSHNTFRSTSEFPSMIPLSFYTNELYFGYNKVISEVNFASSKVSDLYMSNNVFNKAVDIFRTNFYASNNYIPMDQFIAGFGIDDDFIRPWEVKKNKILITGEDDEVEVKESFDNLSYSYKQMHTNYRDRGDLNSANLAYVKLKDITLSRDYYLYKQNGGFELWIKYRVGMLIRFYTNSSTSPALAIVLSFLIILAFSFFYMFYPSEWDIKSKPKLVADYKLLVEKNKHGYFKPFLFLGAGFVPSWLHEFTLSLNAFVTLGFGAIPTTGTARYLTIIQGFLGWFLLSLFTVALINQALT